MENSLKFSEVKGIVWPKFMTIDGYWMLFVFNSFLLLFLSNSRNFLS